MPLKGNAAEVRHVVALSGGKDSTAMALRLAEVEPRAYEYVITPTGDELPEMVEHWRNLGALLGSPLKAISTRSIHAEVLRQKCLPNFRMRWCTRMLKIEPFQAYLLSAAPCVSYVGLRADETDREGVDHGSMDGVTNRYPLMEWGWSVGKVLSYLEEKGVGIPERTDCAMCFFQRLSEWWRLWKNYPEQYQAAEELEWYTGHTLRSESRDTWPAALRDLRKEFESGKVPRGADQLRLDGMTSRKTMCAWCAR